MTPSPSPRPGSNTGAPSPRINSGRWSPPLAAGPLPVGLSALDLGDVLDICIDNVFAHTADGTPLTVELDAGAATVHLVVRDGGPGVPDRGVCAAARHVGLGLQFARTTVERAHGTLTTSPGGRPGALVSIELPQGRSVRPAEFIGEWECNNGNRLFGGKI